jgi:hypothetical protein
MDSRGALDNLRIGSPRTRRTRKATLEQILPDFGRFCGISYEELRPRARALVSGEERYGPAAGYP